MTGPGGISRRQFSGLTGGLAAMGLTSLPLAQSLFARSEQPQKPPGYIDAHVHVWTPDTQDYPLAEGFQQADMRPPSFTPEQLFEHTRPSGVDRIVLIQMSFYRFENSYMLDTIAKHPGVFSGVGIVDHQENSAPESMKAMAEAGVRGFRLHSRGEKVSDWVNSPGMARVWQTARAENLAVCPLINPQDLPHIAEMCRKFPGTRVVIDHFARIGISGKIEEDYLETLCGLAKFPEVYVKTSAFYALGKKQAPYTDLLPMIRRVVDAFGVERLMWASDCPFQVQPPHTYEAAIALIRDRADFLSDTEKTALLRTTAEKVFFS